MDHKLIKGAFRRRVKRKRPAMRFAEKAGWRSRMGRRCQVEGETKKNVPAFQRVLFTFGVRMMYDQTDKCVSISSE